MAASVKVIRLGRSMLRFRCSCGHVEDMSIVGGGTFGATWECHGCRTGFLLESATYGPHPPPARPPAPW